MYLFFENDIPGYEPEVNIRAIFDADQALTEIAKKLGVPPIASFYAFYPLGEVADLVQEPSELDCEDERAVDKKMWYEPEEGLHCLRPIIEFLEKNPDKIENGSVVTGSLKDLESALHEARKHNVRWIINIECELERIYN